MYRPKIGQTARWTNRLGNWDQPTPKSTASVIVRLVRLVMAYHVFSVNMTQTRLTPDPSILSPKQLAVKISTRHFPIYPFITAHHYLKTTPPGYRIAFGVYHKSRLVGAVLFNRPRARKEDQKTTLENTRTVLLDCCPKNAESYVLAKCIRIIKQKMPKVRRIISYADIAKGHTGTIYRAVGFRCTGITKANKNGWMSRLGRKASPGGKKYKYELWIRSG